MAKSYLFNQAILHTIPPYHHHTTLSSAEVKNAMGRPRVNESTEERDIRLAKERERNKKSQQKKPRQRGRFELIEKNLGMKFANVIPSTPTRQRVVVTPTNVPETPIVPARGFASFNTTDSEDQGGEGAPSVEVLAKYLEAKQVRKDERFVEYLSTVKKLSNDAREALSTRDDEEKGDLQVLLSAIGTSSSAAEAMARPPSPFYDSDAVPGVATPGSAAYPTPAAKSASAGGKKASTGKKPPLPPSSSSKKRAASSSAASGSTKKRAASVAKKQDAVVVTTTPTPTKRVNKLTAEAPTAKNLVLYDPADGTCLQVGKWFDLDRIIGHTMSNTHVSALMRDDKGGELVCAMSIEDIRNPPQAKPYYLWKSPTPTPVKVVPLQAKIIQLVAFGDKTFALGDQGELFFYGDNLKPVHVPTSFHAKITSISPGGDFFIATLEDGSRFVQLLDGVDIAASCIQNGEIGIARGRSVYDVFPGGKHCLILANNASRKAKATLGIYSLGSNSDGQLGMKRLKKGTPTGTGFVEIKDGMTDVNYIYASAGSAHSLILSEEQDLYFFGKIMGLQSPVPRLLGLPEELKLRSFVSGEDFVIGVNPTQDCAYLINGGEEGCITIAGIEFPEESGKVMTKIYKVDANETVGLLLVDVVEIDTKMPASASLEKGAESAAVDSIDEGDESESDNDKSE